VGLALHAERALESVHVQARLGPSSRRLSATQMPMDEEQQISNLALKPACFTLST